MRERAVAGINYLKDDATCPQAKGVKIICHICNDLGGWGKGFVLALSKRWDEPEAEYHKWYAAGKDGGFGLGAVQFVQVEPYIWVANMVGQRGLKRGSSGPPIRYPAVAACLQQVAVKARELGASVHMPRIGCGLAGGKWSEIEPLIDEHLIGAGVAVTVYDFE
jgi:O-acetyl-ADP-ribose deacetylase (regulator of RNase III)